MPGHLPSHYWILLINCLTASLRLGNQAVTEERDFFGFVVHGVAFFSWTAAYGGRLRGSMQLVCGEAQAGAAAEETAARRPSGARPRGQPSRWQRTPANRKR